MDFTDVGISHTILNSVQLNHLVDFSPSAAAIAKEARLCVLAIVVGWITTRVVSSLCDLPRRSISQNKESIPGWTLSGESFDPSLLSDKLILTPPYPGSVRGSAWAQSPVLQSEWSAEFQFRATGPERASGNLQLWYTKDGQARIGASSIYTVGPFDGFALVIDTHGGRGGSIRGFLNDGTTDYKTHRSVDSLAFGHCDYAYRNLGRPSVVKLKHTNSIFQVTVDDKVCFSTNMVLLPTGNTFGLTAATPENPDSFEIFKFVLEATPTQIPNQGSAPQQQFVRQEQVVTPPVGDGNNDVLNKQFGDLGGRLQVQNQATNNILQEIKAQSAKNSETKDAVASLDARLQRIEDLLQSIQRDLEGKDYGSRFNQLHDTLRSSHLSLSESLQGNLLNAITASTPRMGFFIFMVIAFQVLLAVSYVVYKRRRAGMPKKYL
ncbi:hypothetical protein N7495_006396 [Penicillium taxi]|uniref:uncharacterized protein n=1 Tax=Penicillium taxi TaxID=168475 RepID=UPI002544E837|nr:uncharacterized protein N7495_006396 [Penicillium taxi]KAJ5894705.1 hypothetical protein N7495_006396 [Penicillium taxi]